MFRLNSESTVGDDLNALLSFPIIDEDHQDCSSEYPSKNGSTIRDTYIQDCTCAEDSTEFLQGLIPLIKNHTLYDSNKIKRSRPRYSTDLADILHVVLLWSTNYKVDVLKL